MLCRSVGGQVFAAPGDLAQQVAQGKRSSRRQIGAGADDVRETVVERAVLCGWLSQSQRDLDGGPCMIFDTESVQRMAQPVAARSRRRHLRAVEWVRRR